jgi:hypothetical protein
MCVSVASLRSCGRLRSFESWLQLQPLCCVLLERGYFRLMTVLRSASAEWMTKAGPCAASQCAPVVLFSSLNKTPVLSAITGYIAVSSHRKMRIIERFIYGK